MHYIFLLKTASPLSGPKWQYPSDCFKLLICTASFQKLIANSFENYFFSDAAELRLREIELKEERAKMEQILNERSREKRERLQLDRMARLEEEVRVLGPSSRAKSKINK